MEYDLWTRQDDQLVQLAQGLASASDALATSIGAEEAAISPSTACELLTSVMSTIMTLRRMTDGLRSRLVASLYRTETGLSYVDLMTCDLRDPEKSVLAADADILRSATSLELVERSLSRARTAIAAQPFEHAAGNPATTTRSPL